MNFNLKAIIGAFLLASAIPVIAMEIPEGFIKICCSKENESKARFVGGYFLVNNINLVPAVKSEALEKIYMDNSIDNEKKTQLVLDYLEFTVTHNGEIICHKEKLKEVLKYTATKNSQAATLMAIELMNDTKVNTAFDLIMSTDIRNTSMIIRNPVFYFETMFE